MPTATYDSKTLSVQRSPIKAEQILKEKVREGKIPHGMTHDLRVVPCENFRIGNRIPKHFREVYLPELKPKPPKGEAQSTGLMINGHGLYVARM